MVLRASVAIPALPALELFQSLTSLQGSVIPRSLFFAFPCACLALALKLLERDGKLPIFPEHMEILKNNGAYSGFSFAMGFLFVFRTSQAYSRYWEGLSVGHRMYAEWMDFAGATVAFSRSSKALPEVKEAFLHRLVRLLSLLHAGASATLRGIDGSHFELIDVDGLEEEVLDRALLSSHPTSLVGQWLMELVMDGITDQVLTAPPPIVSRAFQEFANGMIAYHDAMKIQTTKFPFPYTQMSAMMLVAHWFITPFVMCQWVKLPSWVFLLTLIQVIIFWALYFTAVEIEFPFKPGELTETHAAARLQREFNEELLVIIDPHTRLIPSLVPGANLNVDALRNEHKDTFLKGSSEVVEQAMRTHGRASEVGGTHSRSSELGGTRFCAGLLSKLCGKNHHLPHINPFSILHRRRTAERDVGVPCSRNSTISTSEILVEGSASFGVLHDKLAVKRASMIRTESMPTKLPSMVPAASFRTALAPPPSASRSEGHLHNAEAVSDEMRYQKALSSSTASAQVCAASLREVDTATRLESSLRSPADQLLGLPSAAVHADIATGCADMLPGSRQAGAWPLAPIRDDSAENLGSPGHRSAAGAEVHNRASL